MYFDFNFEHDWLEHMRELHRQQNEDTLAPVFPSAFPARSTSFLGMPLFYFIPSNSMNRLDPEHEEQILQNIKKIIEYMYSSVGLPEARNMRDAVDEPTPSPEEAGLDIKLLTYIKHLVEKGVFSEFPE